MTARSNGVFHDLPLRGGREAPVFLMPVDGGAARCKLDLQGQPIESAQSDRLQRLAPFAPIEPRLFLTGMFNVMADAASIVLCADRRSVPVAMEADHRALEAACLMASPGLGQRLLVSLDGLLTLRPSMEPGQAPRTQLVVERFVSVAPGQRCPAAPSINSRRDDTENGLLEYAQRIVSSEGQRDGLYWPVAAGEPPSPIGARFALAALGRWRGTDDAPQPFHGYCFRPLTAQGPHAPGGAYDYRVKGHQIGGFALLAWPAQWGVSGIMTFIVNHDGVVHSRNFRPQTPQRIQRIQCFDPGPSWKREAPAP